MRDQIENAVLILKQDEGWRGEPYYCSEGYPTIGYGFKIGRKGGPLPKASMSKEDGASKLSGICQILNLSLTSNKGSTYSNLSEVRKAVVISMAYQVGFDGLLKFKKMWAALEAGDLNAASKEILNSLAARQAPARWKRNSSMLETGELLSYYTK